MSEAPESAGGRVRPLVAVAFATVGFVALVIFGLGMLSLALDEDVISVPGLGQLPGVVATTTAALVFAGGLWSAVRVPHPSFWAAPVVALAVALGYVGALWVTALVVGADPAAATAAAGRIATTGFGAIIAGAALVAAWAGIALVRTRARRPRWPWERDEE
ncbi:hypothetical protein [Microbacterium terricola]|uniref:Uncharacterized protein n=1 Tax=Microbacterium terricola TaxID=344163 RepID=A0ABM8DVK8_9MICO|nr:hypothetical protein [Microbacterium terricola]UYK39571.1 hypothetical protein OAU46_12815 [Microbacterium terricola]BDV29694.1 hypothetical protein Microterr_03540 [Microbacterium terricola]